MVLRKEGSPVVVHSLGENAPGEFRGVIRGLSVKDSIMPIYIVELVDKIVPDYAYSCCTMPASCLKDPEETQ